MTISREQAQEALTHYLANDENITRASEASGIPFSTLRGRLHAAYRYGLDSNDVPTPAAPGRYIKGVSTLYDGEGNVRAQWVKESEEGRRQAIALEELQAIFEGGRSVSPFIPAPQTAEMDLLTVYPISDHHLGMYAWADEAGEDYDLAIGAEVLRRAMSDLVTLAPPSGTAIVLNLGDFFHADTSKNMTAQSGNILDVDTRYAKVFQVGIELMLQCIDLTLQKHESVIVRCLSGNHDEHTALALACALEAFYRMNPRVTVDLDPSRVWAYQFGNSMLAATHGDTIKMGELPGVMAAYWPEMWGKTRWRYGYTGHIHHNSKSGGEKSGVQIESFRSLAGKDAYHFSRGYHSMRSMVSITMDREMGERYRHTSAVVYSPRGKR